MAWLADHFYKVQARLAQRRELEQERERMLLSKIERTDVQGLDNVLTSIERGKLEACREKLQLLTIEEQRVDLESWIVNVMKG